MDSFEDKRGMVKMLLDMLKQSAAKEMSDGMKVPEGMPKDAHGVEIEKVSVMPGDKAADMMDKSDDMHEEGDMSPEDESMADKVMTKGEPMAEIPHPMDEAPADMPAHDETSEPLSAFSMLMKKKGKK